MTDNEMRYLQLTAAAQEMMAVASHVAQGSYEAYVNFVNALALAMWNADHNYLDGMTMDMWQSNLKDDGLQVAAQYRYFHLAKIAAGEPVTTKDGKRL